MTTSGPTGQLSLLDDLMPVRPMPRADAVKLERKLARLSKMVRWENRRGTLRNDEAASAAMSDAQDVLRWADDPSAAADLMIKAALETPARAGLTVAKRVLWIRTALQGHQAAVPAVLRAPFAALLDAQATRDPGVLDLIADTLRYDTGAWELFFTLADSAAHDAGPEDMLTGPTLADVLAGAVAAGSSGSSQLPSFRAGRRAGAAGVQSSRSEQMMTGVSWLTDSPAIQHGVWLAAHRADNVRLAQSVFRVTRRPTAQLRDAALSSEPATMQALYIQFWATEQEADELWPRSSSAKVATAREVRRNARTSQT